MNYYELSRRINVYDQKEAKLYKSMVGVLTPAYHRYYGARWMAWYRVFYRLNDVDSRRRQIEYSMKELKALYN